MAEYREHPPTNAPGQTASAPRNSKLSHVSHHVCWLTVLCSAILLWSCGSNSRAVPDAAASPPDARIASDAAELDATPPPPGLVNVTIVGNGQSLQLRQGAGTVRFVISGINLTSATVSLAGLPVTVAPGSDGTTVLADVLVVHGARRGYHDLVVSTPGGEDRLKAIILITPIEVSPTGDDGSGRGTGDAPFRTATFAAGASDAGDLIILSDGEYSAQESWPLFIKTGVMLAGSSISGTILHFTGDMGVRTIGGSIAKMTISGVGPSEGTCIVGSPRVSEINIDGCRVGISMRSGSIFNVVFRRVLTAVRTFPSDNSTTQIDSVDIEVAPHTPGFYAAVVILVKNTKSASVSIENSSISASGQTAISIEGDEVSTGKVSIQGTHIVSDTGLAINVGVDISLDFGTNANPGRNTINAATLCVDDGRAARQTADGHAITMTGTKLNGTLFSSGTVVIGAARKLPFYDIHSSNNRIVF